MGRTTDIRGSLASGDTVVTGYNTYDTGRGGFLYIKPVALETALMALKERPGQMVVRVTYEVLGSDPDEVLHMIEDDIA